MSDFLKETLINPAWWFTAILIGLLVSIIGNKLTDPVSNWLGTFITSIRLRNEEKRAKFDAKVQYLLSHPHEELILRIESNRRYIENLILVISLVVSVVLFLGIYMILVSVSADMDFMSFTLEEQGGETIFSLAGRDAIRLLFLLLFAAVALSLIILGMSNEQIRSPLDELIKEIDRIREEDAQASDN